MSHPLQSKRGFTLVELMVAMSVLLMAVSAAFSIYIMHQKMWGMTSLRINTSEESSNFLGKLIYGNNDLPGLREFPTDSVITTSSTASWKWSIWNQGTTWGENGYYIYYDSNKQLYYFSASTGLRLVADGVLDSSLTEIQTNGATQGIVLNISVLDTIGGKSYTNNMETYVQFRN